MSADTHHTEGSGEWFYIWGSASFSSPFLCCSQLLSDIWQRGSEGGEELGQEKQRTMPAMERDSPSVASFILCDFTFIWWHSWHRTNWACGFFLSDHWHVQLVGLQALHISQTALSYNHKGCICENIHPMDVYAPTVTLNASNLPSPPFHPRKWQACKQSCSSLRRNNSFKSVDTAWSPLICADL